jgi:hypothetical protein
MRNITSFNKLAALTYLLWANVTVLPVLADQSQFQRVRNFNPANTGSRYKALDTSATIGDNETQDESDANNLAPLTKPSILPPDTLSRPPLGTPNSNLTLPQLSNVSVRPSLSWRSKAYKLSLETGDLTASARHPGCIMNGSMQDSLNAIAQACQTNGFQILGQSLPAGQLGARQGDVNTGRYLYVFALKKIADDRTSVRASVEPDGKGQKLATLNDLLNQAASLVDGKGLL